MMKLIFLGLIWLVGAHANFYKTNVTDLSKCKVHYSRSGSVYKDFYRITESPGQNDTLLLDFHFSVLAPSDAHILLASSETVQKSDPAYEIVIGAGGNTFSDIRRKQKSEVKASKRVKGLLSALDPLSFWIHITKDGDIGVGKEGEELPFLSWVDPDPLPINVISFSTWSGIEAKWYFDCERKNETAEIEKPLTYTEKLRKDLLYHYNPYVRPVKNVSTITTVLMTLQINHLSLDEYKGCIEVIGMTKMAWHDEKLRWDPAEYGEMETIHIFRREIWQPDLVLLNAVGNMRQIMFDGMMVAHSTGLVEWNPAISLRAWCAAEYMGRWPRDLHLCSLILGFMQDFNHLRLQFNKNESSLIYHSSSEWQILEANIFSSNPKNDSSEPALFEIDFSIWRNSDLYDKIFFTPFIIISISLLSTFWMDPFGKMKISIGCVQLILTTLMILVLAWFIPQNIKYVPYLVTLYSFTLVAILVAVVLAIIVINLSRNKKEKPLHHLMCTILNSKVVRCALWLPKMEMFEEYGKLTETSSNKLQEKHQLMWILLGVTIDRISFIVFLALTAYAVISYN